VDTGKYWYYKYIYIHLYILAKDKIKDHQWQYNTKLNISIMTFGWKNEYLVVLGNINEHNMNNDKKNKCNVNYIITLIVYIKRISRCDSASLKYEKK